MTWSIFSYFTTPSSNSNINGINIAEGCPASGINDAIRQMMADLASYVTGSAVPSGTIMAFAGPTAPAGFVLGDGSAYSRTATATAALFAVIGTAWGAGDGSTTFNVPDYRGKVVVGAGAGFTLAAAGGEQNHTLVLGEVPADSVTVSGTAAAGGAVTPTLNDPGHVHAMNQSDHSGASNVNAFGNGSVAGTGNTNSATTGITANALPTHTHTFSGSGPTNGTGGAHNNMQPYAVANVIIKL